MFFLFLTTIEFFDAIDYNHFIVVTGVLKRKRSLYEDCFSAHYIIIDRCLDADSDLFCGQLGESERFASCGAHSCRTVLRI